MAKNKKIPLGEAPGASFNNPLAGLGKLLQGEALPSVPAPAPDAVPAVADVWGQQGKVVVRREKKGRGGKTVTVVSGLSGLDLNEVAQQMRRALGCGASVEDHTVVLQGAQGERAAAWLQGCGVRRVVVA